MATDAQSLLSAAACYQCYAANPYMADLLEIALLLQISQSTGAIPAGNYGGGQPNFTPTTSGASAIDTSTGKQWLWFNNAWH